MKKLLFSSYYHFFRIWVVPKFLRVKSKLLPAATFGRCNAQEESFVGTLFSDPLKLKYSKAWTIHLERVRLRDQDTNLILDMIQTITGRYILRPQNFLRLKSTLTV